MSVAHCCTWLHDWSTLRLHALFALIIAGHVAFIWAGDVYNVSSNTNNLELQTQRFHNDGGGPYKGLILVESAYAKQALIHGKYRYAFNAKVIRDRLFG